LPTNASPGETLVAEQLLTCHAAVFVFAYRVCTDSFALWTAPCSKSFGNYEGGRISRQEIGLAPWCISGYLRC